MHRFRVPIAEQMGFDWSVDVTVEFCQTLDREKISVKRLLEWLLKYKAAPVDVARREYGGKRQKVTVCRKKEPLHAPSGTDNGNALDLDAEDFEEEDKREFVKTLLERARYSQGCEFDLMWNRPQYLDRAFKFALTDLVGASVASNFDLVVNVGGAHGKADEAAGAVSESIRIVYNPASARPRGDGVCAGRGVVNVPWGVALRELSMLNSTEVSAARGRLNEICAAFGLPRAGEAGWHLVTIAEAG